MLWEKSVVGVSESSSTEDQVKHKTEWGTTLGKHVVIESMAVVEAKEIGDGSVVESGAKVGLGCVIGKVPCPRHML